LGSHRRGNYLAAMSTSQLKEGGRYTERRSRLSKLIVVSEIALSVVLLAAAGLLAKSLFLLNRVDPGFRTDHLLTVEVYRSIFRDATPDALWRNWTGFYQQLLTRIEALPGVESAGATLALPFQGRSWEVNFSIDGRTDRSSSNQPEADVRIVSNNYFNVMKIPLKSGRPPLLAQRRPQRPLRRVSRVRRRPLSNRRRSPDIRQAALTQEPPPGIYLPYTQEIMPWQTLVIRTKTDPISMVSAIRREVFELDPRQPVARVATLDRLIAVSTAQPRFRTALLGGFAIVALGVHPSQVLFLVLRQGLIMVSAGLLAGTFGALALTRLLASLLFNTTASDSLTFAAVVLILALGRPNAA
jgi:putative ABC transport system permease protein